MIKDKKDRISTSLKFIIFIVIFSFTLGMLFSLRVDINEFTIVENQNFISKFLNIFMMNFWIIFIMWIFGKYRSLFIVNFFIVFVKCFLLGTIFMINIKCNNFLSYFKYFIVDFFVYLPLLIFVLYENVKYNFDEENIKINYDLLIIIYAIWCLIYASICSIIGSNL